MNDISAAAVAAPSRLRMRFHGRGGEYFGIWIVNLLLSIVTLGIYSAWAKVRTQQYFYGATELEGARFGYHGLPKSILVGRIIAFLLFLPYIVLNQVNPLAGVAALLIGLCFLPWLVVRAMRFRLRVTSYRNIRFSFDSAPPATSLAYRYYLWMPMLMLPTFGLILPYLQHQQFRYLVDRSRYGTTRMSFKPDPGVFYVAYLQAMLVYTCVAVLIGIGVLIVIGIAAGMHVDLDDNPAAAMVLIVPAIILGVLLYIALIAFGLAFRAWIHKVVYDRISLGDLKIEAHYSAWGLYSLNFLNILLILFTLGLGYPWAKCRTARYMLDNLVVVAPHGLDHFTAGADDGSGAVGDQVASMFDVDIGIGL